MTKLVSIYFPDGIVNLVLQTKNYYLK